MLLTSSLFILNIENISLYVPLNIPIMKNKNKTKVKIPINIDIVSKDLKGIFFKLPSKLSKK